MFPILTMMFALTTFLFLSLYAMEMRRRTNEERKHHLWADICARSWRNGEGQL
jgi:hypothetical protein